MNVYLISGASDQLTLCMCRRVCGFALQKASGKGEIDVLIGFCIFSVKAQATPKP